jgi:hypothetical protein
MKREPEAQGLFCCLYVSLQLSDMILLHRLWSFEPETRTGSSGLVLLTYLFTNMNLVCIDFGASSQKRAPEAQGLFRRFYISLPLSDVIYCIDFGASSQKRAPVPQG